VLFVICVSRLKFLCFTVYIKLTYKLYNDGITLCLNGTSRLFLSLRRTDNIIYSTFILNIEVSNKCASICLPGLEDSFTFH